jgi:Tfp pilus assembly protein FimV
MNKLIVLVVSLMISSCSTNLAFDSAVDPASDARRPSPSAEVIKASGLAGQKSSNLAVQSEELEIALRSMLSRLVRSTGEVGGEGEGWEEGAYLVKPGDTLSDIVHEAVKGTDIHPDFVLNAIVRVNPSVFVRGNPNWMLSGKKIKFPQAEDFHRMIFKEEPENEGLSVKSDPYEGWITYP